ncbi:hypothetical protein ABW20_dc0105872 [Dactylellina cionopaga]|nr:hypothetical protein ABW20_dc0105872 [Dactylellina cionopaga]
MEGDVLNREDGEIWDVERQAITHLEINPIVENTGIMDHRGGQSELSIYTSRHLHSGEPDGISTISRSQNTVDSGSRLQKKQLNKPNLSIDTEKVNKIPTGKARLEQMQSDEDSFLDSLDPEAYDAHLKNVAGIQKSIKLAGGYLPVPLGIRNRYTDQELAKLGFAILSEEEDRARKNRENYPDVYANLFAGMEMRAFPGNIVPLTSEWDETGGMMTLNQQVPSPKRIGGEGTGRRDINWRLLRYLTYLDLWRWHKEEEEQKKKSVIYDT